MFCILELYGIPPQIVNAIRCIYTGAKSFVNPRRGHRILLSEYWSSSRRHTSPISLHHHDGLRPQRGNAAQRTWCGTKTQRVFEVTSRISTDLDFADDIALVSHTIANAQCLMQQLETAANGWSPH